MTNHEIAQMIWNEAIVPEGLAHTARIARIAEVLNVTQAVREGENTQRREERAAEKENDKKRGR